MADSVVNLSALQRVDPYITEVVESATQVALYRFSPEDNEWDKTGVEGTLFVYKRSGPPVYGFIIMNRLSKTNQVEPITKELELQREDPYLLYRNSKLNIFGIWFYEKSDCSKISNITTMLLQKEKDKGGGGGSQQQRMRRASESDTAVVDRLTTTERTTPKDVNILSMLSKAQEVYSKVQNNVLQENKVANEPKSIVENPNASINLVRPKAVRAGGTPEAPTQLPLRQPEKLSVEALFAIAAQGKVPLVLKASPVPPPQGMSAEAPPSAPSNQLLQHLMSNPKNLVEHIERQQRSELPASAISSESLEKDIKEKLKLTIPAGDAGLTVELLLSPAATSNRLQPVLTPAMLEKSMSTTMVNATSPMISAQNPFSFAGTPTAPSRAPPISLMSPMMFMSKPSSHAPPLHLIPSASAPSLAPMAYNSPAVLLPQNGFSMKRDMNGDRTEPTFLSKAQFTRAMIYLLENDTEFVARLHDAYMKQTAVKKP